MPEFQPVAPAHISAIQRPGCPKCQHHRMLLSKLEAGPPGFDARTFECQKCGCVHTAVVSRDPMTSDMRGGSPASLGRRPRAEQGLGYLCLRELAQKLPS